MNTSITNKSFRWIRSDLLLDFDIPKTLAQTIEEIELADANNDVIEYNILSDTIDVLCKSYCTNKVISREQWELICEKFPFVE